MESPHLTEPREPERETQPNTIRAFLDAIQRSAPEALYHYASVRGLQGILESGEIWATNVHYLNDISEYTHALGLAREYLRQLETSAAPDVSVAVSEMLFQLDRLQEIEIFVASFSEEMDLLSQWRAYCPARGGFSIGLSPSSIVAGRHANVDLNLRRCVYDSIEQQTLIRDVVEWSIGPQRPESQKDVALWAQSVSVWFLKLMALTAPILKHPSFHEEKEWRLIVLRHDDTMPIRFRSGETMMIPYISCPLQSDTTQLAVRRVVVGPTAELALSFQSMRQYLGRLGFTDCRVATTKIPYRNW